MPDTSTRPLLLPASALRIACVGTAFSFVWSSAFIAGKIGMASSGPLTLLSLRFLLAGALLWLLCRLLRISSPGSGDARIALRALAAGLLGNAVYLGLTYTGMQTVPAGLTTILVSTSPLLTTLLASAVFREAFGWRQLLGLAAGFAGVVWIMHGRGSNQPIAADSIILILVGTVALAVSTLLNRTVVHGMGPLRIAMIQLPTSGLALLPIALLKEGLHIVPDAAFWGSLIYQASIVSIGTTLMLLWLVRHGGVARASGFHLLNPIFGTLLSIAILHETVPASDLLGCIPIIGGLSLVLLRHRR